LLANGRDLIIQFRPLNSVARSNVFHFGVWSLGHAQRQVRVLGHPRDDQHARSSSLVSADKSNTMLPAVALLDSNTCRNSIWRFAPHR
jgi:hypothetical protein